MYCEVESKAVVQSDPPCEPFNLCLWCFSNAFPEHHDHPRSSFATKVIVGPKGVRPVKGGIITRFEKDVLDLEYKEPEKPAAPTLSPEDQLNAMMSLDNDQNYVYLDQWRERKVCAFCNDEGLANKDPFIGPYPFLLASTNRYGDAKKKNFWAHDACARHSPEVIQGKDGTWYNVSMAMRRGRTVVRSMSANVPSQESRHNLMIISKHLPVRNARFVKKKVPQLVASNQNVIEASTSPVLASPCPILRMESSFGVLSTKRRIFKEVSF